jgi:YaiO family outer membrane protein
MKFIFNIAFYICFISLVLGQETTEKFKKFTNWKIGCESKTPFLKNSKLELVRGCLSNVNPILDKKLSDFEIEKTPIKTSAETDSEINTAVQITTNLEVLTKNLGTWKSVTLNVRHDFSKRKVLYGFYQKTYRASLSGDTATVGYYQPLSKKLTLLLEASASPANNFLPKFSGLAQLETKIARFTFLSVGYRRTNYRQASVNILNTGVEKYWRQFRFTYSASFAKTKASTATFSNRISVDKYYGRYSSSFNADLLAGKEIASIFTVGDVTKSSLQSVGVGGKHWINKKIGILYRASFHRQGTFYNKGGTSFGIIFRF